MSKEPLTDLVAARRWLDASRRSGASAGAPAGAAADAARIGAALSTQIGHQAQARGWLLAAAGSAPPWMLAAVGGALVDAAAPRQAEVALRRGAEAGDPEAMLHLGRYLMFDGRDEEADPWVRAALEAEPLKARGLIADLQLRGADRLAERWAVVAAEMGDSAAAIALAHAAAERRDDVEAERWFEWAELLGHEHVAMERFAVAARRGDEEGIDRHLAAAAVAGHPDAQMAHGMTLVENGEEAAGLRFVCAAADAGQVRACIHLAALAGLARDRDGLVRWMLAAADADPSEAAGFADTLLEAGSPDLAEQLLRVCVQRGHEDSRVPLGRLLVARGDAASAAEVVGPAAWAGLPEAAVLLGLAEERRGRLDQARAAYRLAAAGGDGRGSHKLGMLCSAAGDEEGACRYFLDGARAGEASSMFNLAGEGPDPARSARWMLLAAAHGHARAAVHVAAGEVAAGRIGEAVRWLGQAVRHGDPDAAALREHLLTRHPELRATTGSGR
nr:hypothetical protein asmbl_31 [uncultured bacterium]